MKTYIIMHQRINKNGRIRTNSKRHIERVIKKPADAEMIKHLTNPHYRYILTTGNRYDIAVYYAYNILECYDKVIELYRREVEEYASK